MCAQVIETPPSSGVRAYQMLIGGEWRHAASGTTCQRTNP